MNPWPARFRSLVAILTGTLIAGLLATRMDTESAGVLAGALAGFVLGALIAGVLAYQLGRTHALSARDWPAAGAAPAWILPPPMWAPAPLRADAAHVRGAPPVPLPRQRHFVIGDDGATREIDPADGGWTAADDFPAE